MPRSGSVFATLRAWCVHQARLFFIALQFFTRMPIPHWVGFEAGWLCHASRFFALIGLVVGAVASAAYVCACWLWPQPVAVLLSIISGILLTGALHEDGFADVCDGFGGATTAERALEIMKDSRVGAYGAIGIFLLLALKWATLMALPTQAVIASLMIAHPLSRMASATLIWRLDYVRDEGKAKPLAHRLTAAELLFSAIATAVPMALSGYAGWLSWAAILAGMATAAASALWLAAFFLRRIGGYTGDCLGAVQQVAEMAFYLAILASARSGMLH